MNSNFPRTSLTNARYRHHPNYLEWYIIFEARFPEYWWDYFCDMNYAHVWALKWDGFNWTAVTPYVGYTEVMVLPWMEKSDFKTIVRKSKWIKVEIIADPARTRIPWVLSTAYCVDQIKMLLGIRKPFIITPKQLWNYLIRGQQTKEIPS